MRNYLISSFGIISGCLLSFVSFAENTPKLTLINHFNQPLTFVIGRNEEVLPDFSKKFVVNVFQQASSQVKNINKEAYVRVQDDQNHSGFFGVDVTDEQAHIYGYLSHGIAYSWKNQTVIFCTPEEYKQNRSC